MLSFEHTPSFLPACLFAVFLAQSSRRARRIARDFRRSGCALTEPRSKHATLRIRSASGCNADALPSGFERACSAYVVGLRTEDESSTADRSPPTRARVRRRRGRPLRIRRRMRRPAIVDDRRVRRGRLRQLASPEWRIGTGSQRSRLCVRELSARGWIRRPTARGLKIVPMTGFTKRAFFRPDWDGRTRARVVAAAAIPPA
jgi:hypothetical protein